MSFESTAKVYSVRLSKSLNAGFGHWNHSAITISFAVLFFGTMVSAYAQQASVTFYTNGDFVSTATPGNKHGVFSGSVFDAGQFLFLFQGHGFERSQNHFVTLLLPSGQHDLAVSYSKDASRGAHVKVMMEAGHHYFMRVNSEQIGIVIVGSMKALIAEVSCDEAHEDLARGTQLIPRRIAPALKITMNSAEPLPGCS
jgi:hypothetical protein